MQLRSNNLIVFLFSLILFSYWPFTVSAQRNNFQTYTLEQGLPQATVHCIIQDNRGYLWLGTDGGGLCRFDGINFKTYGKKEGFKGQNIRSLLQDKEGRIWVGTKDEGIIIYDGYRFISVGKKEGLSGSVVLCMAEDDNGSIWAGTDDGGLNKITRVAVHHQPGMAAPADTFRIEHFNEDNGLSSNSILDVHFSKNGLLWLATFGGVNVLSLKSDSVKVVYLRAGREIETDLITSVAEEKNGTMWFGTYDRGVFKLDTVKSTGNLNLDLLSRKITVYNRDNGFDAKSIWKVFVATNGEIWFTLVDEGLMRYNPLKPQAGFSKFTDKEGLPGNQMLSLFQDNSSNIWIGTNSGGLCKFMGDMFAHYTEKDGLPVNCVQGIDMDTLGNIWFGTSGGGLVQMNLGSGSPVCMNFSVGEGLSGKTVLSVSKGRTKHNPYLWAAVSNAGISQYTGKGFVNYSEADGILDNSVYSIFVDGNGIVWVGSKDGISRFDGQKFLNIDMETMKISDKDVNAIIQDERGNLWFGTGGGLARYSGDGSIVTFDEVEGLMHKEIKSLAEDPFGNIWIGTNNGGLYRFDVFTDDSVKIRQIANDSLLHSNSVRSIIFLDERTTGNQGKEMLVGTDKGIDKITFDDKGKILKIKNYNASDGFTGVECNDNAMFRDPSGNIWIGTVKGLTRYNPAAEKDDEEVPILHITGIKLFFKEVDWKARGIDSLKPWFGMPASLELPYSDNHVTITYAAISLGNAQKIKYRYMLEGAEEEWSPDRSETSVTFSGLSPGTYTFKVIAAGANGKWNTTPAEYTFVIDPPWYRSTLAYIIYVIVILGSTWSYAKIRERNLIREKKILEDKVQERTAEVVKQKEELEEQKHVIEEKNKDITDSINYAEKIQRAILPDPGKIRKAFPESFILFEPRDIVSGDFFWYNEVTQQGKPLYLLAAADCTGHGVPGAFMSMINTSLLNESVNEKKIHEPNEILNETRRGIIRALKQTGASGEQKDGMDVGLVAVDMNGSRCRIQYAGANNSMYIIRKSDNPQLEEVEPDPMPVAISDRTDDFSNNILELSKGDTFYLFTDGYADQFGGPKGKKFKYSQFKKLLLSIQDKTMDEQHEILHRTMAEWKGSLEQIDDILVIGVRV